MKDMFPMFLSGWGDITVSADSKIVLIYSPYLPVASLKIYHITLEILPPSKIILAPFPYYFDTQLFLFLKYVKY